jgi:hypothetical protein
MCTERYQPAAGPTVLAKMLMMKVWYKKAGVEPKKLEKKFGGRKHRIRK